MKCSAAICCILIVSLSSSLLHAQTNRFDWLKGQRINYFVQLKTFKLGEQGTVLKYRDGAEQNDEGNYFSLSKSDAKPTILRARKTKMNIKLSFLNPIRYSVKISVESQDNPLYQTTSKFIETVTSVINLASGGLEGLTSSVIVSLPSSSTSMITQGVLEQLKTVSDGKNDFKESIKLSAGIANWLLWYNYLLTNVNKDNDFKKVDSLLALYKDDEQVKKVLPFWNSYKKDNSTGSCFKIDDLKQIVSRIEATENYFHSNFSINYQPTGKLEGNFLFFARKVIQDLQNANDQDQLKTANTNSSIILNELSNQQKDIREGLKLLEGFGQTSSDLNKVEFCKYFKIYSKAEFANYTKDANDVLDKRDELIRQLKDLVASVDQFLSIDLTREVSVEIGKMKSISILIFEREIKFEQYKLAVVEVKDPVRGYCTISESSWAIPELAGGIVFPTNLRYRQYGVDIVSAGNDPIVVDQGDVTPFVIGGLFLNLIFEGTLAPGVFPMLQFGVGTGRNLPTLMSGIGVRFYPNVSISFGYLGAFDKVLPSSFVLGRTTVQNLQDLESKLSYKLVGGGVYLGFQWKF